LIVMAGPLAVCAAVAQGGQVFNALGLDALAKGGKLRR
jgi:hypothetical protein